MSQQWLYDYCNSTFWNQSLLYESYPSFTPCFQQTVLVWVPCGLALLGAIYLYISMRNMKNDPLKLSILFFVKQFTSFLIFALFLVQLFYRVYQLDQNGVQSTVSSYVTPALFAIAVIIIIAMQFYAHKKGLVSSGMLFLIWFTFLLCTVIPFTEAVRKQQTLNNTELFDNITTFILFGLLLVIFIINMFAEPRKVEKNTCPESQASFLSKIFFQWFSPMIWLGYKKPLVHEDLWDLNNKDKSEKIAAEFNRYWQIELEKCKKSAEKNTKNVFVNDKAGPEEPTKKEKKKFDYSNSSYNPSLPLALGKQFRGPLIFSVLFKLCNDLIQFISPQLVSLMIGFTENFDVPLWQGYFFAASLYIVAVIKAIALQQYFQKSTVVGMRIRASIVSVIYRKALVISNSAKQSSTVGEIVNLMSTDAQRLMDLMTYIHILWSGPLQIILSLVFLWQQLQEAVLAGFAVMIVLIPLNILIVKRMRALSTENMKFKDKRIKLMNEILNGIKVLKLYAWEESFQKQVLEIRKTELALSRKIAYLKAMSSFLWTCAPFFVSLVSFGVYLALDPNNVLDSETAFVSLSLFNILQFPLMVFPMMITFVIQAQVSIKRITKFLLNSEIDESAVDRNPSAGDQIVVKEGEFAWEEDGDPVLNGININIKPGELVAVVGHVGSGKSSLVSALLGEMEKNKGYVGVKGSVAYVPQQAWIQNASLQENILFGKSLDDDVEQVTSFSSKKQPRSLRKFYNDIIKATALAPDLEILPAGDGTEIGEKGINLSGGQKQRVSLARAVFADKDVYFLDDPLSAVDSHIGKHIFNKVIGKNGLLHDKTRLLVTHGVHYLPNVDRIIVLEGGKITEVGTYKELLKKGEDFAKFLEEYATKQEDETDDIQVTTEELDTVSYTSSCDDVSVELNNNDDFINEVIKQEHRDSMREKTLRQRSIRSSHRLTSKKHQMEAMEGLKKKENGKEGGKLTDEESAQTGSVKFSVFFIYIKAIGYLMCLTIVSAQILYQGSKIGTSLWLSDWSESADVLPVNESRAETGLRLGVYGALGVSQAIFVVLDAYTMAVGCIHASKLLHSKVLLNIFRAPISFFDTTPMGRIVNRFSKDVYTVDEMLPQTVRTWNNCMLTVVGTIAVIMYSTPEFGIVIIPIGILYFVAQRFYVRTSRQLKRLESVTRSPIYNHFSETLSGVSVIRAFRHEDEFIKQSETRVDKNQQCYYPNLVSNRWLAIHLDVIGNAIVFFAALFAVLSRDSITGGLAGLSLSYALQITNTLNWWVRQTSEVEIHVVAVERLKEYAEEKNEAPWKVDHHQPNDEWPGKGAVSFKNYSTRYREGLDLVLKNINCDFHPGEKVGIVGRTGAGKSSMTLALFRLIEPAGGSIVIDGTDLRTIGLHDLRSKLTIIPQDPVLFSGSLRLNLDPFGRYSDEELWNCLEHAHLKDFVVNLPEKLEHICAEGGENLSVGQRQLVCLGRALLRKSKILVLDEATAAVDLKTDDLIQDTIKKQFKECTVITIAHRLNTIMDYDRILVLDAGEIREFDSPASLIKQQSVFYGMAKDAGLA